MKRRYLALLPMALVVVPAPAWAAELLVIGSENSDVPEGAIVDSAAPLRLDAGARLTLLAEDGTTITLEGPFDGAPPAEPGAAAEERSLLSSLKGVFSSSARETGGTTRGATSLGAATGAAWLIDTGTPGDVCARPGGPVTLWRAKSDRTSVLTLSHKGARTSAEIDWPRGVATLDWPAAVPLENGADYLMRIKGVLVARTVTLHLVPGDLPSDAHRAAWMAGRGCLPQARALLSEMR